jgi:poly(A) polymerase
VQHEKFRAAYDFLLLREDAGENHNGAGQFWTEYQFADEANQERMAGELSQHAVTEHAPSTRKPRRRRKPSGNKPTPTSDS